MPEKPWKKAERQVAKRLGGVRVKRHGEAAPDVVSPLFEAQVILRKRLPRWITNAVLRVQAQGSPRKMRVVILMEAEQSGLLVVMALTELEAWFGQLKREQ